MLSLPMNEAIQEMFKEVYIEVEFKVVELEAMLHRLARRRQGRRGQGHQPANNIAYVTLRPGLRLHALLRGRTRRRRSASTGAIIDDEVDKLITEALNTFDAPKQDALMARVHEKVVDDAVLIWVVHDTNPHALSPKIKSSSRPSTGSRT